MLTVECYVQVEARNEESQPHVYYSAVHDFWSVEELAELADGPMGVAKWRGVGVYSLGTSP